MFLKEKKKRKRIIVPEIPRGYKAHPFSIDDDFTMPENLANILENNGLDFNEYAGNFIVPPQVYLKHVFGKRFVPWQALLFNDDVMMHVRDSLVLDESGTVNKLCAGDLAYLKLNHCLLYGKLDIVCSNGKDPNQVELEYNTTAHYILEPGLKRFLKASWHGGKAADDNKDVYDRLKNIPIKYRNGVYIYILQKDEVLLDFIYLPKLVHSIGFIKINLTPNILFAVTDRQLVILEDDFSVTGSYTWLLTYIPINNIKGISFEKHKRLTKVIIKIKKNDLLKELQFTIGDRHKDDVKRLITAVIE